MKKILLSLAAITLFAALSAYTTNFVHRGSEETAITDLLERCYIHGAFNELNPEAMAKGFHEDFAIFRTYGDELTRYEIEDWVKNVANKKNSPDFDPLKAISSEDLKILTDQTVLKEQDPFSIYE